MIDLHIHTNNSDGQFDVTTILKRAEQRKLDIISIADHNSVEAYKEIDNISLYYSGKLIPGIELDFIYHGILMHMLGYNIDIEKMGKQEYIQNNQYSLSSENKVLNYFKKVCDELNIVYTPNLKITEKGFMANDVMKADMIQYTENTEILTKLNILGGSFYWGHVCNPQSPFFVDQTIGKCDIYSVVNIIKETGGLCFLAHPFIYNVESVEDLIKEIYDLNLIDGIECYHGLQTKENAQYLVNFCNERGLMKSGGSDFHNDKYFLGYAHHGTCEIENDLITDWYMKKD